MKVEQKIYISILGHWWNRKQGFAFVDTKDYLADQIFIRHKLRVYFGYEFANNEGKHDYLIIFCKVKKKDVEEFDKCMKELQNKMLLLGYTDYVDFATDLVNKITQKAIDVTDERRDNYD